MWEQNDNLGKKKLNKIQYFRPCCNEQTIQQH